MTLVGLAARKLSEKKRNAKLAAAFPNGVRCQKCLELGHWSYECKAEKRKFLHRTSRTKQLNKRIDEKVAESSELGKREAPAAVKMPKTKRSKHGQESSSSSSSSDDSDTDDDSDSESSSDSESGTDSDSDGSSDSSSESSSSSSSSDSSNAESTNQAHLKKTKIENKTSSSASSNEGADN